MVTASNPRSIIPGPSACRTVEDLSGQKVSTCFQCEKCSGGCPLTFAMDILPHRVIRLINLGMIDEVTASDTIWVCASCETCTARCPNEIDIAHVMDTLRQISASKGVKPSQRQAPIFHNVFLANVRRFGRMHEMSLALEYAVKSEGLKGVWKQMSLGMEMLRKGKVKFIPGRLKAGKQVDTIFSSARRKKP